MTTPNYDILVELHNLAAKHLRNKLEAGEASAADIQNIIRLLKENGIQADPTQNENLKRLTEGLPVFDAPAEEDDDPLTASH